MSGGYGRWAVGARDARAASLRKRGPWAAGASYDAVRRPVADRCLGVLAELGAFSVPALTFPELSMVTKHSLYRPSTTTEPRARDASLTRSSASDWGLLLVRLTFGVLMAGHGAQKLFGLFGGGGLTETGRGFAALGYRPGKLFAVIGGLSELLGGLGLALGLLTPLAAAALIGVMINAMATVTGAHGLWDANGGVEYSV